MFTSAFYPTHSCMYVCILYPNHSCNWSTMNAHSVGETELSVCFTMACKQHLVPFTSHGKTEHVCMYVLVLWHLLQEWTKLERSMGAPWPMERETHAACCLNYGEEHPQLLVTGGVDKNCTTLQDAWILDVKSGRWRRVSGDAHMNV